MDKRIEVTLEDVLIKLTGRPELPNDVAMTGLWQRISNEKLNDQEFGVLLDAAAGARDSDGSKSEEYKVLRDLIAATSTRIAVAQVQKLAKSGETEDALQAARVGILAGIKRWDPEIRAVSPVAYLSTAAKFAIHDSWRRENGFNSEVSMQVSAIDKMQKEAALENRDVDAGEIVEKLGISHKIVESRLNALNVMCMLSTEGEGIKDIATDGMTDHDLMTKELIDICRSHLSEHQWSVFSACLGITENGEDGTIVLQNELAKERGVSASAINKSYTKALEKLSKVPEIREWAGKSPLPTSKKSAKIAQKSKSKSRNEEFER